MELYGQLVFKEMKICLYVINFETHEVDFSLGNQTFFAPRKHLFCDKTLCDEFSDVLMLFLSLRRIFVFNFNLISATRW